MFASTTFHEWTIRNYILNIFRYKELMGEKKQEKKNPQGIYILMSKNLKIIVVKLRGAYLFLIQEV